MEQVEISQLPRVWTHGSLHQSEIYNQQRIQLLNNKLINGFLGGTPDLVWL